MRWDGHRTWYRVVGDLGADQAPLVTLHGGPGAPSYYLESLDEITARTGRPTVFYDQVGCGRSDHLPDAPKDFWTIELFKRELVELTNALNIAGAYHVYGHSWGGMLALEHAFDGPAGLRSLVLANTSASTPLWRREAARLISEMPMKVQETLRKHEEAGTTDDAEYGEATMEFYKRHLCRIDPFPEAVMQTFASLQEDLTVYRAMWGPNEFFPTSDVLADWDVTDRLREIEVPALLLSGRHDEATPTIMEQLHNGIADSEWHILENSSHFSHLEEKELTQELVEGFLVRKEREEAA